MVVRVGIIGLSEGNGHPFSFASIINGYSDSGLASCGWPVIYEYVRRRHRSEFGFEGLKVTHAWTQDPGQTTKLCEACLIPNQVAEKDALLGQVDAVIIARDDYQNHWTMAKSFLEAGLPVFVDKPLSLDVDELRSFTPHLHAGRLMSCSGMRYARELDVPRNTLSDYGRLKLVRSVVPNSWDRYAVHALDAVLNVIEARPVEVVPHEAGHESVSVRLDDGCLLLVDALGTAPVMFRIDLFGTTRCSTHEIEDNFTMFRRILWEFSRMVQTRNPPIPPERTMDSMKVLIAGSVALSERRTVSIDELRV